MSDTQTLIDLSHVTPEQWDETLDGILTDFGPEYAYPPRIAYGYEVTIDDTYSEAPEGFEAGDTVRCILGECMHRLGADLSVVGGEGSWSLNSTIFRTLVKRGQVTLHPDVDSGYLDTIQAFQDGRFVPKDAPLTNIQGPTTWQDAVTKARAGQRTANC